MVKAKQIKPNDGVCNNCLNKREDGGQLFEVVFQTYGRTFKTVFCSACLKDLAQTVDKSRGQKGKEFTSKLGKEMQQNYWMQAMNDQGHSVKDLKEMGYSNKELGVEDEENWDEEDWD